MDSRYATTQSAPRTEISLVFATKDVRASKFQGPLLFVVVILSIPDPTTAKGSVLEEAGLYNATAEKTCQACGEMSRRFGRKPSDPIT